MKTTVVIPLYNHMRELRLSMAALLAQQPPPDEIIIVDDASDDGSAEVAENYASQHSWVRVVRHQKNSGASAALNTGLQQAAGDIILFAGADDAVLPGLTARARELFERYPDAGLFCSEVALFNNNHKVNGFRPAVIPNYVSSYITPEQARTRIIESDNWLCGPSIFYHRARLLAIGGFANEIGSLCDGFAARELAFRHGFIFEPQVMASWRVVSTSLSHSTALDNDSLENSITTASNWVSRRPDAFPKNYAKLYERRYRFGVHLYRINAETDSNKFHAVLRLACLYLKYRPASLIALLRSRLRSRRLAEERIQYVEKVLSDHAAAIDDSSCK